MSVESDVKNIGIQAASMVGSILEHKRSPGKIGIMPPIFIFSDGVLGTPHFQDDTYGFESGAVYRPVENVRITAGICYDDYSNSREALEIKGSVYNLFDEDYSYPATPGTLLDDYPALDRTFFLEARYMF